MPHLVHKAQHFRFRAKSDTALRFASAYRNFVNELPDTYKNDKNR